VVLCVSKVSADPDAVIACHCGERQRRTGSVFGVGAYFKREHVHAEGPSKIYVRDGKEGRKLRMHFCPTCGTPLFRLGRRLSDAPLPRSLARSGPRGLYPED
jgi:hypothetical protein